MVAKDAKPRNKGLTMVREPGIGLRALADVCEAQGDIIDTLKIPWGAMRCQPRELMRQKIQLAKQFGIGYSTGGILERVLLLGNDAVLRFLDETKTLGFEEVEISSGAIVIALEDKLELIRAVREFEMKPVPEVAMVFGVTETKSHLVNADVLVNKIQACIAAGAPKVVIEEEGLTQNVANWQTDIMFKIGANCPLDKLVFEADDRQVYTWYMKHFGPNMSFHVDMKDCLHLECTRRGVWGKENVFGRMTSFRR